MAQHVDAQQQQPRQFSRRAFLQGAASLMGAATLAACTAVQPSASGTESSGEASAPSAEGVTVLWWYSHGGTLGELMQRFASDFTAANEGITIQPEFQGGYEELMNKLIVSAAAGALPDLIHVGDGQYPPLARAGILLPLDDLVDGPNGLDLSDYFSPIERGRLDGVMYQIAFGVSTPIFYYNVEALENVGLSGVPETWDDFFNTYLPAFEGGDIAGFAYSPGSWWQQTAYWSNGIMVNDDNWEVDLANPLAAQWYTQMQEGRRNELVLYPVQADQNASGLFGAGRAAMMIESTGVIGSVDELTGGKFTAEVGFLPAGEAGRYVPSGGNGLSISNNAAEANRDAAWAFIKYLHEPTQFAEYDATAGYIPLMQSTTDAMADLLDAEPRRRVAIEQYEFSRWHMRVHTVARANNELQSAWNESVSLDIEVQPRLDQLQETVVEILREEGFEPTLPA
jgi:sn-glycerol 3-phosphate transport system substrate-binding protein